MTANKKTGRNNGALYILLIVLAITSLISVTISAVLTKERQEQQEQAAAEAAAKAEAEADTEPTYTQTEVDALVNEAYISGQTDKEDELLAYIMTDASAPNPGYVNILRSLYPDYMVYYTANGFKFRSLEGCTNLSPLSTENFVICESGEIKYTTDGLTSSRMGIDVSEYQGNIDWQAVSDYGVSFAIMRAGYRGYVSGALVEDAYVRANLEGAAKTGIEAGLYFFSQAITEAEAIEEANILIDMANEYGITGPLVIDVEKIDSDSSRGNQLTMEERTLLVNTFCSTIRNAGYTPMIYGNNNSLFEMLDFDQIQNEKIWYASFTQNYYFKYEAAIWQYSDTFTIPGINGNVDVDLMF